VEHLTPDIMHRIQRKIAGFHRGRKLLIEKTVSNCLRVPLLDAIFPNAKYIFLLRNGCDVVESSYRQWIAPPDWDYIMTKARSFPLIDAPGYALKYVMNMMKIHNPGVHKTWGPRYRGIDEDMATKDLLQVCAIQWARCIEQAYLSLEKVESSRKIMIRYEDFVKQPLRHLTDIAAFLDIDASAYRNDSLLSVVSSENIGKGWHRLTDHQQKMLLPFIRKEMMKLGCEASIDL
jgi:hypothetical protein